MKIQYGKLYINHEQDVLEARKVINPSDDTDYPFRMHYLIPGTPYTVTETGLWGKNSICVMPFDIIKEVTQEEYPEYYL